ncbi:MAG: DUF1553 domain-containing protein, partial [Planctomycetales bacterium]|nr:DUF1553 domain-containing protein [Planctomycetales bacterium]
FDPITQRDYYGLQAVFAGTDKANRLYDPDPTVARRRRDLTAALSALPERVAREDATLLAADVSEQVAAWEAKIAADAGRWRTAQPVTFESAYDSQFKLQDDGSLLAGGPRPERDTYSLVVRAAQRRVTGLRLEVLTDDSLPHNGPGRQDNGNLHLNEIRIWKVDEVDAKAAPQPVAVKGAAADFNQQGWTVEKAIDGDPSTAWGVYPEVGKPHQAMFAFAEAVESDEPVVLKVELQQTHGGGHLIGRPRIAATDADDPLRTFGEALSLAVAAIVELPAAERTPRQRLELAAACLQQAWSAELAALPPQQQVYCGSSKFQADGSFRPAAAPRPVFLLERGSVANPRDEIQPAALNCLPELPGALSIKNPSDEGQRPAALARWTADPRNALTWRSAANRVWHYHFGRGLVDTPSDFGRMGSAPTHPQLLDWLAVELRDGGGSLKRLHRLIVVSATYRQSSQHVAEFARIDGENLYLWRMNRSRLDAECVHDALLRISGDLDATMGGPSLRQFNQSPGVHVTPVVDYLGFDVDDPGNRRRSVYRFLFRTLPDPFMEALDCPDASQFAPVRGASFTPLQALALLNNKWMVQQSEHIAERAQQSAAAAHGENPSTAEQVDACYRLIFARAPSDHERDSVSAYAERHGLANACRVLINSNEFMFVE